MGLKKYLKKYKEYENKELRRRAVKKEGAKALKSKANKTIPKVKIGKFCKKRYSKAIGNPYRLKL